VLALLAAGAGVLGLLWASGGGGPTAPMREASSPAVKPAAPAAPIQPAPVLHGVTPSFKAATKVDGSKPAGETTPKSAETSSTAAAPDATSNDSAATAATAAVPAGPAATKVAHRFADAFVLYETGQDNAKVRAAFAATATPHLARALLRRPPRLPANAKVPKAKVLNIVPGPKHGETYTMSVSLLRVGLTSELRIEMAPDPKSGEWHVKGILG
jgi:hypothetical protein